MYFTVPLTSPRRIWNPFPKRSGSSLSNAVCSWRDAALFAEKPLLRPLYREPANPYSSGAFRKLEMPKGWFDGRPPEAIWTVSELERRLANCTGSRSVFGLYLDCSTRAEARKLHSLLRSPGRIRNFRYKQRSRSMLISISLLFLFRFFFFRSFRWRVAPPAVPAARLAGGRAPTRSSLLTPLRAPSASVPAGPLPWIVSRKSAPGARLS